MINITILSLEDKHLRIIFRDNGVGFDEKEVNDQGLGLQIVKMLVKEKLRGTIEFKYDNGTCILISFKI
jgi:two-component sensor histidine kinase